MNFNTSRAWSFPRRVTTIATFANSLRGLIEEVRPRAALFTTYTLSLAFVESALLPLLDAAGCADIHILVDAQEARNSTAECSVKNAGRRYGIWPVVAPGGGIFHPKVAYLEGESEDVLVVGSGNLTLSGQHKQLETVDAVRSGADGPTFDEFAGFCRALAACVEVTSPGACARLLELGDRAQCAARKSNIGAPFPQGAALIHTLEQPALGQIAALWAQCDQSATTLTVLSPFHASDAAPVRQLASRLGNPKVVLGLDPVTFTAPFDPSRLKPAPAFVVPRLDDNPRPLHAKIVEVRGAGATLVATGSVNATWQSLTTTKNVEICLARRMRKSCFQWDAMAPVQYRANAFPEPQGEDMTSELQAEWGADGRVSGHFASSGELPSEVQMQIQRNGEPCGRSWSIELMSSGDFSFGPIKDVAVEEALQLTLAAPGVHATCWLNVQSELGSPPSKRQERRAIGRILDGQFDNHDLSLLVHMLIQPAEPDERFHRAGDTTTTPVVGAAAERAFSYQEWARSGRHARSANASGIHGKEVLRAFSMVLQGGGPTVAPKTVAAPDGLEAPVDEAEEIASALRKDAPTWREVLQQFIRRIPAAVAQQPPRSNGPMLAQAAGMFALNAAIEASEVDDRAMSCVLKWLDAFSRYTYANSGLEDLRLFALGASTLAAAWMAERGLDVPYSQIKESLGRLWGSALTASTLDQQFDAAMHAHGLAWGEHLRPKAREMLSALWATPSTDDQLSDLAERAHGSQASPTHEDEALAKGLFRALQQYYRGRRTNKAVAVLSEAKQLERSYCPHCWQVFRDPVAMQAQLRARHAVVCPEICGKPIFYVEDLNAAKRLREVLNRD